jgi:LysR family glycine cleavage system transcriptional activator
MAVGDGLLVDEIALGRLIRPFKVSLSTYGYFLTYPPDALQRPTAKAFRDWIIAEARAHKAKW